MGPGRAALSFVLATLALTALTGCGAGYLWQAAMGQMELLRTRRPIEEVIADPATGADLRQRLELVSSAIGFAHGSLGLPDNGSYRDYAELHRPFAVWNVFAAPEFSLELHTSCFPIAGCVGYRGYFREDDARSYAAGLAAQGFDVEVDGTPAYSTLGYFRDPVLSTVMHLPDWQLPGLIFHELAHQLLYVAGDTTFSESFAMAVEEAGLARWLASRHDVEGTCRHERLLERRIALQAILADTRGRLEEIYAAPVDDTARRRGKDAVLGEFAAAWGRIGGAAPEGRTFNNASLGALAAYDEYLPGFRALLASVRGDLPAFYAAARRLAALDPVERRAAMVAMSTGARDGTTPSHEVCSPVAVAGLR